jgi:4-hydroxy-2-oxoheptanedioate aldolase
MPIPASAFSLARRLHAGETIFTAWCGLPYPILAEIIAREGFAAVTLDSQHGLWDVASLLSAIAAVRLAGSAPIVRIPMADNALVSRALDFGAEAIIAPMINSAADARALAAAAKYPPVGERSWGPHRALMLGGIADQNDYLREANRLTFTFAMTETATALANLHEIAATPGIDGLFLGPSDLSIALSQGGSLDPLSKAVEEQVDRIADAASRAGKIPGAYCHNAERALALAKRGMRFLAVSSDIAFARAGAAAQIKLLSGG